MLLYKKEKTHEGAIRPPALPALNTIRKLRFVAASHAQEPWPSKCVVPKKRKQKMLPEMFRRRERGVYVIVMTQKKKTKMIPDPSFLCSLSRFW
jgi:hypothetical protein